MYQTESTLTKRITKEIGWIYSIHAIETMKRTGKIYIRGTMLKPDEAQELKNFCEKRGYRYMGPFA